MTLLGIRAQLKSDNEFCESLMNTLQVITSRAARIHRHTASDRLTLRVNARRPPKEYVAHHGEINDFKAYLGDTRFSEIAPLDIVIKSVAAQPVPRQAHVAGSIGDARELNTTKN